MLKVTGVPRLSNILRSVQKSQHSRRWRQRMDGAHLSAWLHCLTASEALEHALGPEGRSQLSDRLDLSPSYGGAGLQSLEDSTDEEFLGYFAAIAPSLITFCRKTEQHVYIRIVEALEAMNNPEGGVSCPSLEEVKEALIRTATQREPLSAEKTVGATDLVREPEQWRFRVDSTPTSKTRPRSPSFSRSRD